MKLPLDGLVCDSRTESLKVEQIPEQNPYLSLTPKKSDSYLQ